MSVDVDQRAVRAAARRVGVQLAVTISLLVVVVLAATLVFVISHLEPNERFNPSPHAATIDVNGFELLVGGALIGVAAVALVVVVSFFATRRAVAPLAEALRIQRAFVADASHELRTPIAVLATRLQLAQRRLAADDPMAATIVALRKDTAALTGIVNDLLVAAGRDLDGRDPECDAEVVLVETVESLRLLAADRGVSLAIDRLDRVRCGMPEPALRRCITAILDNAIKHSPDHGEVVIRLFADTRFAELSVRDAGPGIRGIEPERMFDRFARGREEDARTGLGIGLSLVRDSVERYGGDIRAIDRAHGAEFVLRIPRADRAGSRSAARAPGAD